MSGIKIVNGEKINLDGWEFDIDSNKTIESIVKNGVKESLIALFNSDSTSVFLPFRYSDTQTNDPSIVHIASEDINDRVHIEFNIEEVVMEIVEDAHPDEESEMQNVYLVLGMLKSLVTKIEDAL